ncbi:ribosomal protein S7 [Trametes sanguinea]|nr:ribosomal protein S7 [Trametes sanguinea]
MFSSIRHAVSRMSLRRVPKMRNLTDSAASDAVSAGETSLLPSLSSSQTPAVASTSSVARTAQSGSQPTIHIPPAEDPLLHLFTSCIMKDGKRHAAAARTAKMLLHIHAFTKAPPLPIFREAIMTAAPLLRCRQFKRAAKQYVFPMPLTERQRARMAIAWILEAAKKRGGVDSSEQFAREIIEILKGEKNNAVIKKKLEMHKLAVLHRGNVLRPPKVPKSNRG